YKSLDSFCLRTPLKPFDFFEEIFCQEEVSSESLKKNWNYNEIINEAIFLASPTLYLEISKWVKGAISNPKREEKIKLSLIKYLVRLSSRSTPFGLFSGCSIGKIVNDPSCLNFKPISQFRRTTSLDIEVIDHLVEIINQDIEVKKDLNYQINSSIYNLGPELRYYEKYIYKNETSYTIEGLEKTKFLSELLHWIGLKGATFSEIIEKLTELNFTEEVATNFFNELFENQILISSLFPNLTGVDCLKRIIGILKKVKTNKYIILIENIDSLLQGLDEKINNPVEKYLDILELLKEKIPNEQYSNVFRSDLIKTTQDNKLNRRIISKSISALSILNRLTVFKRNSNLENFKTAFKVRYGDRRIPLSTALDIETGIGYMQNREIYDTAPFLSDIIFNKKEGSNYNIVWNKVYDILLQKVTNCLFNDQYEINITENDFSDIEENWSDLPDTLAMSLELITLNKENKIVLNFASGSSAANLISRFCHVDNEIKELTKEIVEKEYDINQNKILAEIIHLPDVKKGNVLKRPALREFEIPFLGNSLLNTEKQIRVEDILVEVINDRIKLVHRDSSKEILPCLTSTHDFNLNPLPIYHFLCHLQNQRKRNTISFKWGPLEDNFSFLPRVLFKDIILARAQWHFKKEDLPFLTNRITKKDEFLELVTTWRIKNKLPKRVELIENDTQLLIDFENITLIQMFISEIKNKEKIKLREFLKPDNLSNESSYVNQYLIPIYNEFGCNQPK
ncbi:hypothetical protein D7036_23595, partial [Aquimarina sp. BL5]